MKKYYIVNSSILPRSFGKVIKARHLLNSGQVKLVGQAAKKVGISRGTYYKYRDFVFSLEHQTKRRSVISFMLKNQSGILSKVLNQISETNASILTINQNIPIHNIASVVISLDLNSMKKNQDLDELLKAIQQIKGTSKVHLVAID